MHKVLIESKHARRHPVSGAILTKITLEDEYGPHELAKMAFLPSFSLIRLLAPALVSGGVLKRGGVACN
jgi:hypothetical protein